MTSGDLRHRVSIQQPVQQADASGNVVTTWQATATRWASVTATGGGERFNGSAVRPEEGYTVLMRGDIVLQQNMRIVWEGRTLNVDSVVIGRTRLGHGVVAQCRELATQEAM